MKMRGIRVPDTIEEAFSLLLLSQTSSEIADKVDNIDTDEFEWWKAADYAQNIPKVTEVRMFINYEHEHGQKYSCPLYACYVEGDGWIIMYY